MGKQLRAAPRLLAARILAASLALSAPSARAAAPAEGQPPLPGAQARAASIAALGARAEGSAGEAAALDYIERELRAAGLAPLSSDFSELREDYSASRIVEARIPGERDDELAIVVPVSSWVDARDPAEGSYGIALALDEAARAAAAARAGRPCPLSLRFVFLGAEERGRESDGEVASLGSRAWIARQEGRSRLAVVYLRLPEAPASIGVRNAGAGVLSPYWLYEAVRRALEPSGIAYDLQANRLQAYRLGLASDYGPAAPYLEAGIPAIELRGLQPSPGGPGEGGGRWLSAFVDGFARLEAGGFSGTWDRHYFILRIGKIGAVMREKSYVAFLVAACALVAGTLIVATVARRRAARRLLRRAPGFALAVLALFAALGLVFLAGKGIAAAEAAALGSAEAWTLAPRAFAGARICFSFFLFLALVSYLVEKRVLTPNPYFYEFAALACLAADALVFSAGDLSASFYFMWALVLVELSIAARRRWATLAAYLLMYVPLLVVAAELALRPSLPGYARLIAPDYAGVLALSAICLPFFVFTASPLLFYARRGAAARKRAVAAFATLALASEALALAYCLTAFPQAGPRRRDLRATELVDQDRGEFSVELTGSRRLGRGSLVLAGRALAYDSPSDRAYLRGEDGGRHIGLRQSTSPFLDRRDESIALSFARPPYAVDLALESEGEILIYDCSLPFKVSVDGRTAALYSGVNPGPELRLSLTVPSGFRSRLVVTARYLSSPAGYGQSSGAIVADGGLSVRASFPVGEGAR